MNTIIDSPGVCDVCGGPLPMDVDFCRKCAVAKLRKDFEVTGEVGDSTMPERIGKYRVLREIGEGGFGIVYLAEQKEPMRRRVALKVLKRGMDTRQVVTRFEFERQALAMMDHPNVATVFDGGQTEDGRPFFAMEYVEGIPITRFCDDHQMRIRDRLELMIQVGRGLQHCHQKGLIHRDVKPPNVLVTMRDGRPVPKIIDFGIAKVTAFLTKDTLVTEFNRLVGTPAYMSPEQLRFDGHDVDVRTDIYSMGVLLYELLTGATPFSQQELMAGGFSELEKLIREQDPPKPSTRLAAKRENLEKVASDRSTVPARLRHEVGRELNWIVMRAMAKSRERRYQSTSELVEDLNLYLRGQPVKAGPPTLHYRAAKFFHRNTARLIATAVVLVLGGVMLSYNLVTRKKAEEDLAVKMLTVKGPGTGLLPLYLAQIQPHLDDVGDRLQAIAMDSKMEAKARLYAAFAVLPRNPEVLNVLMTGLLTLDPTIPDQARDLEAISTILIKYRNEESIPDDIWSSLKESTVVAVDSASWSNGEAKAGAGFTAPLAAVAVLAKLDPGNPRWGEGLTKKAVDWIGTGRPLDLSQFRRFLEPVVRAVHFPDPMLRAKMSNAFGRHDKPVMDFDLLALREFKAESKITPPICDLTGLETALNLERLDLDVNTLENITALSTMTKMKELDLQRTQLTHIGPISVMKELVMLDIRQNKIKDLSPLSGLHRLEELEVSEAQLSYPSALDPLRGLVNLKLLELENSGLSDLSFLVKLSKLKRLDVRGNQIIDLSPLLNLPALEFVDVSYNQIMDPKPLLKHTNIKNLTVIWTGNPGDKWLTFELERGKP